MATSPSNTASLGPTTAAYQLSPTSTPGFPNRIWVFGDLVPEYYFHRATEGGLIISEGIPQSLEVFF
jgi:hypothetical protein